MKYAIVLPDGAADFPLEALEGRTPFEAADTPRIDELAIDGRLGTVRTTPAGMPCGSDVCTMSLLGYDPARYHTGRAPLEAAAMGVDLARSDWVFRVNLVSTPHGVMQDHSAGHIGDAEASRLLTDFADAHPLRGLELRPGVSYRHILVDRDPERDWDELVTTPPHDIPGQPVSGHLPLGGDHAALLRELIESSTALFADHEINQARRETGQAEATCLWPWGQGVPPTLPSFEQRFGLRGAMITAVDLLAGLASFLGWDRLDAPGQSSYHDTDYAAAGRHAADALHDYDVVAVHIEAPDEAAHAADARTKVAAIEAIDRHIVGPLVDRLRDRAEPFRLLLMPDHYTRVDTRKHDPTPPPFLIHGHEIHGVRRKPFTENNAQAADLHIAHGHELMEFFLRGGL